MKVQIILFTNIDEREGSLLKQFTFEETAVVFKCLNQFKLV